MQLPRARRSMTRSHGLLDTRRVAVRVRGDERYGGALYGAAALLLGLLAAVLGFAAVMMWVDARNHAKQTSSVAAPTTPGMPRRDMGTGAGTLTSSEGAAPANADALAAAHKPYPAAL